MLQSIKLKLINSIDEIPINLSKVAWVEGLENETSLITMSNGKKIHADISNESFMKKLNNLQW